MKTMTFEEKIQMWFESKPQLVAAREWCMNHETFVVTFWTIWSAVAIALAVLLLVGQILCWIN